MKALKEITPTSLRKNLFQVLKKTPKSSPTRVHYKEGDSVILSYEEYLRLKSQKNFSGRKGKKSSQKLKSLVSGKILKPLNQKAEEELLDYMGISK